MTTPGTDRLLFVGTGGGNDVFSTLFAVGSLWEEGWRWKRCDIAGVVSPFHRHTLGETGIAGVSRTMPDSARFLSRRGDERRIGFVDARVADLVGRAGHGVERVLALSLERGTEGLTASFAALAREYEHIVLVDVGGDIFYSGPDDAHVLSPMFDAMVLRSFVDSGASGFLFEAGPGTDGELEPESLQRALAKSGGFDEARDVRPDVLRWWEGLYRDAIEPHRPGRTVPMTIAACRSDAAVIRETYRARAHLGNVRRYATFTQRIDTALCKRYYLVRPELIDNPFAVTCGSVHGWFLRTQVAMRHTNNEANLEYDREGGELRQFLTPSPLFKNEERDLLLESGLCELAAGICDAAWLLPDDWERMRSRWETRFSVGGGNMIKLVRS